MTITVTLERERDMKRSWIASASMPGFHTAAYGDTVESATRNVVGLMLDVLADELAVGAKKRCPSLIRIVKKKA